MESLRSALQPLTHNLPVPITDFGRNLIGPYCYKTLILDIDPFTAPDCVKLAVSKGLGIAIVGASSIVKIPQLIKLINSGSAEGISFTSYFLESSAYLISLVYNIRHGFPFSTYGETALILAQNVVISCYVLSYTRRASWVTLWVAGLMLAGAWMWRKDLVPVKTMAWLQAFSGVLGVASKVPQIVTIWEQGGTGQLSAFAVVNYLLGSLSRIFTTLQEVPDPLILYGFIAGFALNAVLFIQVLYYWNSPATKSAAAKNKKLNKPIASEKNSASTGTSSARVKSPSTRRRG